MNKPWKSDTLFRFERSDNNHNMRPLFSLVRAEMDAKCLTKGTRRKEMDVYKPNKEFVN